VGHLPVVKLRLIPIIRRSGGGRNPDGARGSGQLRWERCSPRGPRHRRRGRSRPYGLSNRSAGLRTAPGPRFSTCVQIMVVLPDSPLALGNVSLPADGRGRTLRPDEL